MYSSHRHSLIPAALLADCQAKAGHSLIPAALLAGCQAKAGQAVQMVDLYLHMHLESSGGTRPVQGTCRMARTHLSMATSSNQWVEPHTKSSQHLKENSVSLKGSLHVPLCKLSLDLLWPPCKEHSLADNSKKVR
eukprot:1159429-Pelagomonas_calceolata.AAC.4